MSAVARKQRRVNRELARLREDYPTPQTRLLGAIMGDPEHARLSRLECATRQGHDYQPMGAYEVQDWIMGWDFSEVGDFARNLPRGNTDHEEITPP